MNKEKPEEGVEVIILKNEEVLIGKRKSEHGKNTWGFPGGKLKCRESLEECAIREVREETGLKVELLKNESIVATDDYFPGGKHYQTYFLRARYTSGTPRVMEPDKIYEWKWFSWDNLPSPLFLPVQNLIKQRYQSI
ncbi:MAG: NUDIX domain-containing protein [Candidatus Pacearchaeota archaeon]